MTAKLLALLERVMLRIAWIHVPLIPIAGGAIDPDPKPDPKPDDTDPDPKDDDADKDDGKDDDPPAGDDELLAKLPEDQRAAVKKVLDAERLAAKTAKKDAKAAKRELGKINKDLEELQRNAGTEEEKKLADAKAEATAEMRAKLEKPIKRSAIRAAAAGKVNPSAAIRMIDLDDIEVDEDGEVDEASVTDAIDTLLEEMPELKIAPTRKKSGGDTNGGGSTKTESDPDQLIRAALGKPARVT